MEKKISKNQKVYPHRFGCSQNHQKAPKNPIVARGLRHLWTAQYEMCVSTFFLARLIFSPK